jgi:hypothetical protein
MSCLCNVNFQSQYAFITSSQPPLSSTDDCDGTVHIHDYLLNTCLKQEIKQKRKYLVCKNGHALAKYESNRKKCHFRHIRSCDVGGDPMTEWHVNWQGNFENTEVRHPRVEGSHKNRFADALEGNNVIEFQHSPISLGEVQERQHDYGLHGRTLNWVIDGRETVVVDYLAYSNTYLLSFKNDPWKYESFLTHEFVFYHVIICGDDAIVRIKPSDVRSNMIDVREHHCKAVFIKSLKEALKIWNYSTLPQCVLYHNQRGAGCGKTYESIQLLAHDDRFKHKTTFIYLTKMHSAKEVIYAEFHDQYREGKLNSINVCEGDHIRGKQYIIDFENVQTERTCKMIIGTIDSFIYALGDKNNRHKDFFKGLLESIINGYSVLPKDGSVKYASGSTFLNKECLVIIDEAQDLDYAYIKSIATIMRNTYIDAYIIGDKLQSIWDENNIYTYLEQNELPNTQIVRDKGANIVRRFHHTQFIPFVNDAIDFEKYGLYPISGVCNGGNCTYEHEEHLSPIKLMPKKDIYADDTDSMKLESYIQIIIGYMNDEVHRYQYLPHNFMFIFPIMKKNVLAGMLETKLQNFWINKFATPEYQKQVLQSHEYWKDKINDNEFYRLAYLHKSEDGQPINLKESEYATRLMSIHTSKGQGCEVIFLLNMSENALNCFSKQTGNLVYDSLLHVAITRQKKSLYIGLPQTHDDVSSRFCHSLRGYDQGNEESLSLLSIYNDIRHVRQHSIDKRFDECDTSLIKPYAYDKFIPEVHNKNDIVDWGHHVIRYGVCICSIILNIINKKNSMVSNGQQIFKILKNIQELPVQQYDYKGYYKALNEMKNNNRGVRKAHNNFPLLQFEAVHESKYSSYCTILNRFVRMIKKKLALYLPKGKVPKLCPIEMTVLIHVIDISCNSIYADADIMSLYEVIHAYARCAHIIDDKHDEMKCICKKVFYTKENFKTNYDQNDGNDVGASDVMKSMKCHYDIVKQVDVTLTNFFEIMSQRFLDEGKFTFNISHRVGLQGGTSDFVIWNPSIPFIAHSDKHVVYFIIKPSFNKLNYNEVIFDALFNKFLISRCQEGTNNASKFRDKHVLVCIFTLASSSPIVFEPIIQDDTLMLSCIESFLKEKYSEVNKKVIKMYEYCILTKPRGKNSIRYMLDKLEEYNSSSFPKYISDYFTVAESKCKTLTTVQKKTLINKSDLDEFLYERISRFVYGSIDVEDDDF